MATNFPTSIDALVNPIATDSLATVNHADQHANANDAIEALEAKVGVTNSAVTSSLDYRVRNINATTAIVSGSSSTDLVRITQTGSGNALVVEDSANPDSTPFVIDAAGNTVVGATATSVTSSGLSPKFQIAGLNSDTAASIIYNFANDSTTTVSTWAKSRGGSFGTQGAVVNAEAIGNLNFEASDGTQLRRAVSINALVDATPTAGVVQGRLQFQTANSSGTLTERMRIDSNGNVGIGSAAGGDTSFGVYSNITGGTTSFGIRSLQTIQSGVTASAIIFHSQPSTVASAFTVSAVNHFYANGVTVGAGSTITTQNGFIVPNTLTGATYNYAFRGSVFTGTNNNWNIYMDGNAPNYMAGRLALGNATGGTMLRVQNDTAGNATVLLRNASAQSGSSFVIQDSAGAQFFGIGTTGNVGIGTVLSASAIVRINKPITGGTNPVGYHITSVVDGDIAGLVNANGYISAITASGSTAVPELTHLLVTGGTSTTKPTIQNGFFVNSSMTDGVTNRGFVGGLNANTDRWNLYMNGTAQNYLAGNTGIGVTVPTSKLHVVGSFSRGAPVTKTASFTLADTENWVICNGTATITVTLPAASTQVGREITIKNVAAFTVVSASSNIVPLAGGAAGTAILPATAGAWAKLVSDGANWQIMQS